MAWPKETKEKNQKTKQTNKKKILKGGKKKADKLGTLGPEEWHSSEFPGFSFASCIQNLELQKYNLLMPMGTDQ